MDNYDEAQAALTDLLLLAEADGFVGKFVSQNVVDARSPRMHEPEMPSTTCLAPDHHRTKQPTTQTSNLDRIAYSMMAVRAGGYLPVISLDSVWCADWGARAGRSKFGEFFC